MIKHADDLGLGFKTVTFENEAELKNEFEEVKTIHKLLKEASIPHKIGKSEDDTGVLYMISIDNFWITVFRDANGKTIISADVFPNQYNNITAEKAIEIVKSFMDFRNTTNGLKSVAWEGFGII